MMHMLGRGQWVRQGSMRSDARVSGEYATKGLVGERIVQCTYVSVCVSLWRALPRRSGHGLRGVGACLSLYAKIKCVIVRWTCVPQVRALLAVACPPCANCRSFCYCRPRRQAFGTVSLRAGYKNGLLHQIQTCCLLSCSFPSDDTGAPPCIDLLAWWRRWPLQRDEPAILTALAAQQSHFCCGVSVHRHLSVQHLRGSTCDFCRTRLGTEQL